MTTQDLGTCRRCGALLRWVKSTNGRPMPLDREPNPDGNVIVDGDRAVVLRKGEEPPETGFRYMPHFATCPSWRP